MLVIDTMAKGKILATNHKKKTENIKTIVYKKKELDKIRLFVALPISKKTRKELFDYGKEVISKINGKCKPVSMNNLHITIIFLGEVEKERVNKVKEDFLKSSKLPTNFKVCFNGLGFFPSKDYIKVVWVGIDPEDQILQIRKSVAKSLKFKFPFADNHPHLTLGRVKFIKNKDYFLKAIQPIKDTKICETEIKEVVLYQTTLTHQGPEYEALCSLQLP